MINSEYMNAAVDREYKFLINLAKSDGDNHRLKALEDGYDLAWKRHRAANHKDVDGSVPQE